MDRRGKSVRLADLLDENGSLRIERVEWRDVADGHEAIVNGSVLTAKCFPSSGPTPEWRGYIGGVFAGYRADNAADVQGALLQRAAFV